MNSDHYYYDHGNFILPSLEYLESVLHGQLISKGLQPPRSADLSSPDFLLWEFLQNTMYANDSHAMEKLQIEIQHAVGNVSKDTLQQEFRNMI
jgi:hypothetical protein